MKSVSVSVSASRVVPHRYEDFEDGSNGCGVCGHPRDSEAHEIPARVGADTNPCDIDGHLHVPVHAHKYTLVSSPVMSNVKYRVISDVVDIFICSACCDYRRFVRSTGKELACE